jgi:hypothetical protein
MDPDRKALLRLIDALVDSWLETADPDDVRNDLGKVDLLMDIADRLPERGEIPERVRTFYDGVFLRDLWSTKNKD